MGWGVMGGEVSCATYLLPRRDGMTWDAIPGREEKERRGWDRIEWVRSIPQIVCVCVCVCVYHEGATTSRCGYREERTLC